MVNRINIKKVTPAAYKTMLALDDYSSNTKLNPIYRELIRIRASQINKCVYCIDLHTTDARELGETEQRIYALSAWQESPLFNDEEKALLALTEEITNLPVKGVSDEVYLNAAKYFSNESIADVIMVILTVSAWNIIGVSTQLQYAK